MAKSKDFVDLIKSSNKFLFHKGNSWLHWLHDILDAAKMQRDYYNAWRDVDCMEDLIRCIIESSTNGFNEAEPTILDGKLGWLVIVSF